MGPTAPARFRTRLGLALLGCLLVPSAPAALPQGSGPVWVSLDGSKAGTPADVDLLPGASSAKRSVVEVRIHGFWREDVVGGDGQTYQRLDFPGLRRMEVPGAPELPEARALLAMGTDAGDARLISTQVLAQSFVSNIEVYPAPIPAEDEELDPTWDPGPGDPDGTPEQFVVDTSIYGGNAIWPAASGEDGAVEPWVGAVSGASVAAWPVSWHPSANRLIVATQAHYYFDHSGSSLSALTVTKLQDGLYSKLFSNWGEVKQAFPYEPYLYHSRYLIVAQPFWWDTLEPFVALKKTQGYQVTVDAALPDVSAIRQVIADWYAAGDPGMDHFCLLVGDTLTIPQGTVTPGGDTVMTDDVYGAIGPINGSKEVHVGRVSIDNEDDLAAQLQKIIDYQVNPVPGGRYDTALLVAHEENYPDKYTASHTNVLTAGYSHPPVFMTSFGGTGGTNQQVTNFITAGQLGDGLGLVAYRGHGSTSAWTGWNLAHEDWHSNNVIMLNNPVRPIVWAITCTNGNIDWGWGTSSDSIAEVWMEVPAGASASYAATRTTSTTPNHHLNETLFRVVYDQGITTHGMAIAAAEASVWAHWPGHKNPWAYLLLGDPSMTIRRDAAADLVFVNLPSILSMDDAGNEVSIQALAGGEAAPDGLFSYHKEAFLQGEDDEMSAAVWLNEAGGTTLPFSFATPGVLKVMARDRDGSVALREIPIGMGAAWTDLGHGLAGANGAPQLAGLGDLQPGSQATLLLTGAQPTWTAWLGVGASRIDLPLAGGLLVPDVFSATGVVLPMATDGNGNLDFTATWPAGLMPGEELFFQAWFVDFSAPLGLSASNAISGQTS